MSVFVNVSLWDNFHSQVIICVRMSLCRFFLLIVGHSVRSEGRDIIHKCYHIQLLRGLVFCAPFGTKIFKIYGPRWAWRAKCYQIRIWGLLNIFMVRLRFNFLPRYLWDNHILKQCFIQCKYARIVTKRQLFKLFHDT